MKAATSIIIAAALTTTIYLPLKAQYSSESDSLFLRLDYAILDIRKDINTMDSLQSSFDAYMDSLNCEKSNGKWSLKCTALLKKSLDIFRQMYMIRKKYGVIYEYDSLFLKP